MARRVDDNEVIEDDDVLFNDDSFLAAIATVEAQYLGRLSSVLSNNGSRVCGEEMNGDGGLDVNIGGKRAVQWEGQHNGHGGPDYSLRGGNGPPGGYSEDDSRKRLRTVEDTRTNWPLNSSVHEPELRFGSGRQPESQQPEGEYMAALRGSNSEFWQSSGAGRGIATAASGLSNRGGASGNAATGGNFRAGNSGTCYKCGLEGHWAKECSGGKSMSSPTKRFDTNGQGARNVEERLCPCGAGACLVLTANTEKNQGRSFYRCPLRKDEGQCTFFEWCDAGGQSTSTERVNIQDFSQQPQLQCQCGSGPCATLTAKTEKNLGRQFYKCPLPQGQSCSFFQWCDDRDGGGNNSSIPTRATSFPGKVASPAPRSCYKCGQEGHWSRECPNQPPQNHNNFGGQSQYASARGATENKTTGNCFKCGGQGHWSTSCPNAGAPAGQTYTKPGGGDSTSGASCYRCGDPDHWANRCPIAPAGQR